MSTSYESDLCRICKDKAFNECNCSENPQYFQLLKILDELDKNLAKLDKL